MRAARSVADFLLAWQALVWETEVDGAGALEIFAGGLKHFPPFLY
jgi:hypothetical protein